jgi:MarR family transcriptional regulator, temperature-dependent positive regulator of motility
MELKLSNETSFQERINAVDPSYGLAWRLNFLANVFTAGLYEQIEARWGLGRPEFIVLYCLRHLPGLLARDIVSLCGRPKNSISRAVNANLAAGLIREDETFAGRGRPLHLTPAGSQLIEDALPLIIERQRAMLAPLSDREQAEFDRLLRKMTLRDEAWGVTT